MSNLMLLVHQARRTIRNRQEGNSPAWSRY
jgi:hypothetical protein